MLKEGVTGKGWGKLQNRINDQLKSYEPAENYLHRPFPNSFEEFKHAMISYSQFGEDLLAQEILGYERCDIFYIDIGAFHPISKSNTYIFYKRGSRGMCVEPNPQARPLI